ncbi:MAG: FtsX-like permease family protein [Bacteroidales bacterium]|nr:FtsX-like permease family protein [Bacteroidales bacterium]
MKSFLNFLKRNKLYSLINLVGLTVSMAFVLLLAVYVQRQLSTDAFQENADRIYLVAPENSFTMAYWTDKHLRNMLPEIEKSAAVLKMGDGMEFTVDNEIVNANLTIADSCFFDMFSYDLTAGSKADWKISWDRCMVSEAFANTHFGDKDPIGRVVQLNMGGGIALTVCGVYKDFGNSILHTPDVLARGEVLSKVYPNHNEAMAQSNGGACFVMTYPGADLETRHEDIVNFLKDNYFVYKSGQSTDVRIIPLRKVYFTEGADSTIVTGNRKFVHLLLTVCLVLLLFAVLNYVNLSTALIGFRAKEMATRRLVGATKTGIFMKMIVECIALCTVAMVLAILLAEAIAPSASTLLEYPISVFGVASVGNVLLVIAFVIVLGFLAGLVPALLIQKAQPIEIVRGSLRLKTKTVYSHVIIIVQNAISVVMLVAALTMFLQVRMLITADLGINTKDILVIDNTFAKTSELQPMVERFKSEPFVEEIGKGTLIPAVGGFMGWSVQLPDESYCSFKVMNGDDAYFKILGIKEKQDNHIPDASWLTESSFRRLGLDESATELQTKEGPLPIGGVYYDFGMHPLEVSNGDWMGMVRNYKDELPEGQCHLLVVKVNGNHKAATARLEEIAKEFYPDKIFEAHYMEDMIKLYFAKESRILRIVLIFTLLSMLVSALGLFAMSSYYMQQERCAVAVKKVFGAEYGGVLRELVLKFMKMVAVAALIGIPVAWFIMHRWLEDYTHRISLSWWIFALAGIAVAMLAFISVIWQSIKTARTNPATVLKKE